MVEYLDTLTPVCKLLPPNGRERADIKCWEALADGMLDAAVWCAWSAPCVRELQSEEWMARQMGKVALSLKVMSRGWREALLRRHPLLAGRCGGGLRAGLAVVPLPGNHWRDDYPNLAAV
jgi:glutathione S-transferase